MLLSICMMIKNEEHNLERCLKSLNKLRNEIESELIIVDTGSEDKSVEIAKKYTDRIYHHKWNNNFSEMRNISISYAKGTWLLIIDADEELVDSEAIIMRLKQNNSTFDAMAINLTNIANSSGKFGAKLTTIRLFKNLGFDRYKGAVHNSAIVKGKVLKVESMLYHYGYISDDKDLMEIKFKRTAELLHLELEKDPLNVYYLYQLGTSYDMYGDNSNAIKYYEKAYDVINGNKKLMKDYVYVYAALARILVNQNEFSRAFEISKIGLNVFDDHIDLLYFSGVAAASMKKFDDGIKKLKEYIYYVDNIEKTKLYNDPSIQLYTLNNKLDAQFNLSSCYIHSGEEQKGLNNLIENIRSMDNSSELMEVYLNEYLKVSIRTHRLNNVIELYNIIPIEKWANLDLLVYHYCSYIEVNLDKVNMLKKLPSELGSIFITVDGIQKNDRTKTYSDLPYSNIKYYFEEKIYEVIFILLNKKQRLIELLGTYDERLVMDCFGFLDENYTFFENLIFELFEENKDNDTSFLELNFLRVISKYISLKSFGLDNELEFFDVYVRIGLKLLKLKYREEFLDEFVMSKFMNLEEQYFGCIYQIITNNNVVALEAAKNIFPDWKNSTIRWLDGNIEKQADSGMDSMVRQLKDSINVLISTKKFGDALKIIDEYLVMFPNDLETILLKSELHLRMNDQKGLH